MMGAPHLARQPLWVASVLIPPLVLLFFWMPVFHHYHVPKFSISAEDVEKAREYPSDQLLNELATYRFQGITGLNEEEAIRNAETLFEVVFQSKTSTNQISAPLDPKRLQIGGSQFFIATFGIPNAFLTAYKASGQDLFLNASKEYIVAWAKYEKSTWLPKGLMWNDHAIAERILVLAQFWQLYRRHPDYDPKMGQVAVDLAARSSRLLAKPGHFTFNTNHGIIQNLALWHYSLAFPTLPEADGYHELAFGRLKDQMQFYINNEGVVLEHSSQYQAAGIRFLAIALRYATLLGVSIPVEWIEKYNRAMDTYAHLRLPDATLPKFGDTGSGSSEIAIVGIDGRGGAGSFSQKEDWRPQRQHSVYPVAGYSIWWHGLERWPQARHLSQVAMTWAYFPGHAHKHADEMSLSFWSGGQRWITNLGYWPYGAAARREAVSWVGSNAPHSVNEDRWSSRETNLRSFAGSEDLSFIDLERKEATGYNARRQVIWKKPDVLVVLDQISCNGHTHSHSRTVWNAVNDVELSEGPIPGSFTLHGGEAKTVSAIFFGTRGIHVRPLTASHSPFAGWEFAGGDALPAPAILLEQPCADSVSGVAWLLNGGGITAQSGAQLTVWSDPEEWEIKIARAATSTITIRRKSDQLAVQSSQETLLSLSRPPAISGERRHITNAFQEAGTKYAGFNDHYGYRVKATKLLVFLFLVSELVLFGYKRFDNKHHATLRTIVTGCWVLGGVILITAFDWIVETFSGIGLPL